MTPQPKQGLFRPQALTNQSAKLGDNVAVGQPLLKNVNSACRVVALSALVIWYCLNIYIHLVDTSFKFYEFNAMNIVLKVSILDFLFVSVCFFYRLFSNCSNVTNVGTIKKNIVPLFGATLVCYISYLLMLTLFLSISAYVSAP